jgi:hypothetical protein
VAALEIEVAGKCCIGLKKMTPSRAGLIAVATLPGVVVHEWAHQLFCNLFGVHVYRIAYFRIGGLFNAESGPLGYVVHARPNRYLHAVVISIGPLIVNSILAAVLGFTTTKITHDLFLRFALFWLAIAIGMHALPSDQDVRNVLERSHSSISINEYLFRYLSYPFLWLILLANRLRRWWVDFVWAALVVDVGSRF